jgi:hypothetical protein
MPRRFAGSAASPETDSRWKESRRVAPRCTGIPETNRRSKSARSDVLNSGA